MSGTGSVRGLASRGPLVLMALLMASLCGCGDRTVDPQGPRGDEVSTVVLAACERIASIVAELGMKPTVTRGLVPHGSVRGEQLGCRVRAAAPSSAIVGSLEPREIVGGRLSRDGWTEDLGFAADGPGTTAFGYRRDGTLCVFSLGAPSSLEDGSLVVSDQYGFDARCTTETSDDRRDSPSQGTS